MARPHDLFRQVFVLPHAMDAYRIHFTDVGHRELLNALTLGEEIQAEAAMALLGRKVSSHQDGDRFVLATHRRGLFVVAPARHVVNGEDRPDLLPWNVVTYLRFQRKQEREAHKLWPSAHANPPPEVEEVPREPYISWRDKANRKARSLALEPLFYDEVDRWGFSHAPTFEVALTDRKGKELARGTGGSMKEASEAAAEAWMKSFASVG